MPAPGPSAPADKGADLRLLESLSSLAVFGAPAVPRPGACGWGCLLWGRVMAVQVFESVSCFLSSLQPSSPEKEVERDVFLFRAYIAQVRLGMLRLPWDNLAGACDPEFSLGQFGSSFSFSSGNNAFPDTGTAVNAVRCVQAQRDPVGPLWVVRAMEFGCVCRV